MVRSQVSTALQTAATWVRVMLFSNPEETSVVRRDTGVML
jgi:hypothetical protein